MCTLQVWPRRLCILFFELALPKYEANMAYSYPGFGFPSPLECEFQEGCFFYSFGHSPLEENVTHGRHPQEQLEDRALRQACL